ncbi:hypothetical protein KQI63_05720 [bacterium]|nr:hypothetical protein [bacterium]
MGGTLGLIGGFIGLVGLGTMIANLKTTAFDPIGGIIFTVFLLNGLLATWRRVTGREAPRTKGPLSTRSKKRD